MSSQVRTVANHGGKWSEARTFAQQTGHLILIAKVILGFNIIHHSCILQIIPRHQRDERIWACVLLTQKERCLQCAVSVPTILGPLEEIVAGIIGLQFWGEGTCKHCNDLVEAAYADGQRVKVLAFSEARMPVSSSLREGISLERPCGGR